MRRKRMTSRLVVAALAGSAGLAGAALRVAGRAPPAAAAGPNHALGRTMTASSSTQTYAPGNAGDGDQSSYWESANNAVPQWIQVDLGSATAVNQVVLK